jgi:hypothetical protein
VAQKLLNSGGHVLITLTKEFNIMKKIITTIGIFIFAAALASNAFAGNMNANRQMGNQSNWQSGGQVGGHANRQMGNQSNWQSGGQMGGHANRQMGNQSNWQGGGQVGGHTSRQMGNQMNTGHGTVMHE